MQRQLNATSSVEVACVGTRGTHVFAGTGGDYDPKQADINASAPFFKLFGWTQNLRYYGAEGFGVMCASVNAQVALGGRCNRSLEPTGV